MEEAKNVEEAVQDVESPAEELTLSVQIPENSAAGDKITVQCPDNRFVQFVTPANVLPGDTVHVTVSDTTAEQSGEATTVSPTTGASYQGVAAVTTGVLVSALVIGPVITGALVIGIVVCAAQRKSAKSAPGTAPAAEVDAMEAGTASEDAAFSESKQADASEPETREQKIAKAFVDTAGFIVDKWSAIDERFAISENALKAIATVQEMDERNKISETVVTSVKNFDQKYQVSETAGNVVNTTVAKARELDETCKLTENVTNAGSNLALCMTDFERRYDITTRITTALIFTMTTLSDAITVYMNRITYGSAGGAGPVSDAEGGGPPTAPVAMDLDIPLGAAPEVDPALSSPTEQGSYEAPVPAAVAAV